MPWSGSDKHINSRAGLSWCYYIIKIRSAPLRGAYELGNGERALCSGEHSALRKAPRSASLAGSLLGLRPPYAGRRLWARRSAPSLRKLRGALRGVPYRRPQAAVACPIGQAYFNCAALARRSETPSAAPNDRVCRHSERIITPAREFLANKVASLLFEELADLLRVVKPSRAGKPLCAFCAGGFPRARHGGS